MHNEETSVLLDRWGVVIPDDLLELALTHRSFAYEHDCDHNERLEFLGDSILGAVVAADIFDEFSDMSEGELSKIKSAAVSERALAAVARRLGLGDFIRLGKGEALTGGRDKDSILSDTMEALFAATYICAGLSTAIDTVRRHMSEQVVEATKMGPALDWRTAAEEKARELGVPGDLRYEVSGEGPDHARVYTATVFFGETPMGEGSATSQKAAKLEACRAAYLAMADGDSA